MVGHPVCQIVTEMTQVPGVGIKLTNIPKYSWHHKADNLMRHKINARVWKPVCVVAFILRSWWIKGVAKLSLCSLLPNRNAETEFGVKQKRGAFIVLPGKGGHSGLVPSRQSGPPWRGRSYSVQGAWSTRGQVLDWLVSGWSFKHHQTSGFSQSRVCVLVVSSFHLGGGGGVCFL